MLDAVPAVDLIDETFLVASPEAVAAAVHDPARTATWWPDLELTVFQDRGVDGIRWTATGGMVGTVEVWCEAMGDGVLLHVYLRCDPTRPGTPTEPRALSPRAADRARRVRALQVKQWSWRLKDELEIGRAPGEPRPDVPLAGVVPAPAAEVASRPAGAPGHAG
jgi:hypothetical protein